MALKHSLIGRYNPSAIISFKDMRENIDQSSFTFGEGVPAFDLPAFLVAYTDSFNSNWGSQDVLGRMDPIYTFKNTQREIQFTVEIPCENKPEDGHYTLNALSALIRYSYPNYEVEAGGKGGSKIEGGILSTPPIIGIKFGNLIQDSDTGTHLPGILNSVVFSPLAGESRFWPAKSMGAKANYVPKRVQLAITFKPIHKHTLGYDQKGKPRRGFQNFPYGPTQGDYNDVAKFGTDLLNATENAFAGSPNDDGTPSKKAKQAQEDQALKGKKK